MLVEVPPKVEYSYSGRMKLVVFASPAWSAGNDTHTKWNPDALGHEYSASLPNASRWNKLLGVRVFGKSPIGAFLRVNRLAWNNLPASLLLLSRCADMVNCCIEWPERMTGGGRPSARTSFETDRRSNWSDGWWSAGRGMIH